MSEQSPGSTDPGKDRKTEARRNLAQAFWHAIDQGLFASLRELHDRFIKAGGTPEELSNSMEGVPPAESESLPKDDK